MQGNNGNEWDDDRPQYQRSGRHLDDQKKKTWQRRKCVSLFKPSFSLAPVWVKERLRNLMAHLRQYFVAKNTRNSVENDHILFNLALGSLQTQSWTIYLVNAAPWIVRTIHPSTVVFEDPVVLEWWCNSGSSHEFGNCRRCCRPDPRFRPALSSTIMSKSATKEVVTIRELPKNASGTQFILMNICL